MKTCDECGGAGFVPRFTEKEAASAPCPTCSGTFAELNPPYSTIVADPPWMYRQGGPTTGFAPLRPPPYSMMSADVNARERCIERISETWACSPDDAPTILDALLASPADLIELLGLREVEVTGSGEHRAYLSGPPLPVRFAKPIADRAQS